MTPEQREKHRLYMRKWMENKDNRLKQRIAQKKCKEKITKKYNGIENKYNANFRKKYGVNKKTYWNRKSMRLATQAGKPWDIIEDALLFSGLKEGEICKRLGRSIVAIEHRKHRLRKLEGN